VLILPRRAEELLNVEQEGINRCDGIKLRKGQVRSFRLEESSNEVVEAPSHRLLKTKLGEKECFLVWFFFKVE